ncbi:intermembrane phospholipid transport protein YdbH family protein [Sphingomonas arenae]|uniref:intermembrane phospholipid transport protein YdbH family protein n=1 Tax=Sphingomonas arenae TaxID=2812555 RepID=UPI001966EB23|nr:YdbH domain-containing protein [Sphingomonas arenae]
MDEHSVEQAPEGSVVARRRRRWPRVLKWSLVGLGLLLVAALLVLWTQRRPIANDILAREMEKRGVQATYRLDRVGLRTQQISNLVLGDPRNPDLTAKVAQVQLRIRLNGSVQVFRVVARGVRLRGRFVDGRISWGQVDKLLPPPSGKPFRLPELSVDIADSSIALATPYGPLGIAVEGQGNLTGGFKGRLAATSPRLAPGRCELIGFRAAVGLAVKARRPRVTGPISAERFNCPASRIALQQPRLEIDSRFSEAFERFDGEGRIAVGSLIAGANGMAGLNGRLTFVGEPTAARGEVDLSAAAARLAEIRTGRTRVAGRYLLNARAGEITLAGDYRTQGASVPQSITGGVSGPLGGLGGTPLEPIGKALSEAIRAAGTSMDAAGKLRLVNFAGGGAVRIETANVRSRSGARIQVAGGDGVTYYWPSGRLRVDGRIAMQGGGLPTARLALSQPRSGAPMSGVVQVLPYAAGNARIALAPIRFAAGRNGSTSIDTAVVLDGPLSNGLVRGLRVPVRGSFGPGGALEFGRGCTQLQFTSLQIGALSVGSTRLPICATGQAILFRKPGGGLALRAHSNDFRLAGRMGSAPFAVRADRAAMVGSRSFLFNDLNARLGQSEAPILIDADRLDGTFRGSGISGAFAGGDIVIGKVPLLMSEAKGDWRLVGGDLSIGGALTVADRNPDPRFYPLRTDDVRFRLADDMIRATGTLRHPASGREVTDVTITHQLSSGEGTALLDVDALRFDPGLQPEELTRLTQGVVALVNGTVRGQGRIAWNGDGEVTSTGEFSTDGTDLAAAFGPVTGLRGTIRFTDLLGLQTAPGQTMQVATVNPGILVENGVITYQLLPDQLVRIQSGRWPFMGGELILRETVLNFGRPTAKRLTFEVVGLDARQFVESFGFQEIAAEGVFDGVLPMIFDENGGRIVGGRLDSRDPGGRLSYNGVVNRANLGLMGGIAFDALRDLRFRSMIIRLDGDLAGEFGTRLTIDGVALGGTTRTQRLIRSVTAKLPIRFNVSISGPFRALIATAKSFRDPRAVASQALPFPLEDVPGISTEVRRIEEDQTQTQTPVDQKVRVEATPAQR